MTDTHDRPVSLAVNGAGGRMGRQLIEAIVEREDAALSAAAEVPGSPLLGSDAGLLVGSQPLEVLLAADLLSGSPRPDVLVDFTTPASTMALLERLLEQASPPAIVGGTTGLSAEEHARMAAIAKVVPVVFAANYSVGVTLALELIEQAARALDEDYDIEVVEAHHRHKVDAPSGTALAMGHALARGRDRKLDDVALYAREGITGERVRGTIGFATMRAGDIVGEHTVMFGGNGERIEITHRAHQRMTFARGAVRAAMWLAGKAAEGPGLYDMRDVLGLD